MIHCHSCIDRQRENEELKKTISEKLLIIEDLCDKHEEMRKMWRNAEDDNIRKAEMIVELKKRLKKCTCVKKVFD